jgi:hypothetical protein
MPQHKIQTFYVKEHLIERRRRRKLSTTPDALIDERFRAI